MTVNGLIVLIIIYIVTSVQLDYIGCHIDEIDSNIGYITLLYSKIK